MPAMPPLNANTTAASAAKAFAAQVPCEGTRVYIAGPMSGLPDLNYPAFRSAALVLRSHGYFVENPAENEAPEPAPTWADWMRLGLTQMLTCSHVLLLPGWQKSKGAIIEARTALDLGLIVIDGETGGTPTEWHRKGEWATSALRDLEHENEELRGAWRAIINALNETDPDLFTSPGTTAVEAAVSSVWRNAERRDKATDGWAAAKAHARDIVAST